MFPSHSHNCVINADRLPHKCVSLHHSDPKIGRRTCIHTSTHRRIHRTINAYIRVETHIHTQAFIKTNHTIHTHTHTYIQVLGPEEMILVPPRHYCIVTNPVKRDADDKIVLNEDKQVPYDI